MVISYVLFCFPLTYVEHSLANTLWFGMILIVFYSSYTLTMVTYYGTFSEVTNNQEDRVYLSNWKAFIDTIQYALGFALIPLLVGGFNIRMIGLGATVLTLTMVIALVMIKEKSTLPKDIALEKEQNLKDNKEVIIEKEVSFKESVRLTIKNRSFIIWLFVLAIFYFGLMLFLTGQNVYASGAMGLEAWQVALMNTSAFAPVPIMLVLYTKIMKKVGFKRAFQSAIISFAVSMLAFSIAYVEWIDSLTIRLVIGMIGGTIGSYGIGAFFSAPYMIPAEAAAQEFAETGKSHPSMYFAMQGLFTAVVGAISTTVIWLNIKEITRGNNPFFGAHLMPYIVIGACVVAVIVANKLPENYDKLGKATKNTA